MFQTYINQAILKGFDMNKDDIIEVMRFEALRIKNIVSQSNHDDAVQKICDNYKIYLNALKSSKKGLTVRKNWIITILFYRKLLKDYGLNYGACFIK